MEAIESNFSCLLKGKGVDSTIKDHYRELIFAALNMSRIVDNQMDMFHNDQLLSQMSQGVQIKYGGCPHAKEPERRQTFIRDYNQRILPVTITLHGINLELTLISLNEHPNNDVSFESDFILNGVCVRFKGRINKQTLIGQAHIELNSERVDQERQQSKGSIVHIQRLSALRNSFLQ